MRVTFKPRRTLAATAVVIGAFALPAQAESFTQWAPVMRATPVYTHIGNPNRVSGGRRRSRSSPNPR